MANKKVTMRAVGIVEGEGDKRRKSREEALKELDRVSANVRGMSGVRNKSMPRLAKACDLGETTMRKRLNDPSELTLGNMVDLARERNCSLDDLVCGRLVVKREELV